MQVFKKNRKVEEWVDIEKKGAVQKLVVKGGWENCRWNERWLELSDGEIRYCWDEGGGVIDRIAAGATASVRDFSQTQDQRGTNRRINISESLYNMSMRIQQQWMLANFVLDSFSQKKLDSQELHRYFLITVTPGDSPGTGREYLFRAESTDDAVEWVHEIKRAISLAQPQPKSHVQTIRDWFWRLYHTRTFFIISTLLIGLNFMAFVYAAQVNCCILSAEC
jgi:hypothetical protein